MDPKSANPESDQATKLASQAIDLAKAGKTNDAFRQLEEASKLSPENEKVKSTREELRRYQDGSRLVDLCNEWLESLSDDDGEEALDYLHKHKLSDPIADEAMNILLEYKSDCDMADQLTGEVLKHPGARRALAAALVAHPTATFKKMFVRGEDTMDAMMAALRLESEWKDDTARVAAIRDAFQLALASLMEAGVDYPDRAMKLIANLLSYEAHHLHGLIDADGFDVILSALDIRLPTRIKKYATLATAKLLESSPDSAKVLISNYVTWRVRKPTADGLIVAFSAAAAVFPMEPTNAAALFLADGFLPAFVHIVQEKRSNRVEQAALDLLSVACMDKGCREGIAKYCKLWLWEVVEANVDARRSNLAALILVKIANESSLKSGGELDDLIKKFKATIVSPDQPGVVDAIEALAFASLNPQVKEDLTNDKEFLKMLIAKLGGPGQGIKPAHFGGVSILENITAYPPPLTEEQKKISELKAYANSSKPTEASPLESNEKVTVRCRTVLDAEAVPLLNTISKGASPAVLLRITKIFLSLSKEQRHRGVLAQQGAVKQLLTIHATITAAQRAKSPPSTTNPHDILHTAAHAVARILISVDPHHIDPLLLFNPQPLLVRAATELVCNLMASSVGVALFVDDSRDARTRLRVIIALTDADDLPTRMAAGGALAMITEWEPGVEAVLEQENGVRRIVGMCGDESEEVGIRGLACVGNLAQAPGAMGERGRKRLMEEKALEAVQGIEKEGRGKDVGMVDLARQIAEIMKE
ncbi:ARM repeat-containing protein [Eremomyces bilateralis CBS 781.70]|uniref:ARM repeat-containing protein n=1 Tax=Eremomyces bilateralis CBS 781.70 TaxID=1392243 RepID=A0A6G1GGZ0_9PEZI|nr:ARM repeat-containing protein [Eremomyces bilateralis CBS 781.70]KAF1817274.1 ARM repeat-containing protein [Eremomyces bilateralis CBS 781.70]